MICISCGDPGGIGPEVTFKAIASLKRHSGIVVFLHRCTLDAYNGAINFKEYTGQTLDDEVCFSLISSDHDPVIEPNHPINARIAYDSIISALDCCVKTQSSLVTAPISKAGFLAAGIPYADHTTLLKDYFDCPHASMGFYSDQLRVVLATIHVPLSSVEPLLTPDLIRLTVNNAVRFSSDLGISHPKIAIAGLNPHASEYGQFGDFESNVLLPTLQTISFDDATLIGPISPDVVFRQALDGAFDIVVSMYHDQGLIPLKLLAFDSAVNVTIGLPICRTSPDHGTAYDIAGTNAANPSAMKAAIEYALQQSS